MIAALIAAWKARKWLPYAVTGGAGLIVGLLVAAGAWSWQANKIDGLTATLKAKQAELGVAAGDARRWEVFAETARVAVDQRNAEIEAQRADQAATELLLEQAQNASAAAEAELIAARREMEKRAHESPDQVRPLGPLAGPAARLLAPQ